MGGPVDIGGGNWAIAENPYFGLVLAGGRHPRLERRGLRSVLSTFDGRRWDTSSVADLPTGISDACMVNVDDRTLVSAGGMNREDGSYVKDAYTCQVGAAR